ncbi:MAG TPA: PQQ-dependent sugar dehydrogenase [Gemmatimonadaceae bacterium]|nr:PQQ-dependent sugar dehydrogenase [Gemmatimonadaceae bacterium]
MGSIRFLAAVLLCATDLVAQGAPAANQPVLGPVGTRWRLESAGMRLRAEVVAAGISTPSSIAFIPPDRILVADRRVGVLWLVDLAAGTKDSVRDVPVVHGSPDGGLLDLVPHPDYARNGWLYFSYSIDGEGGQTTVLDRARLADGRLVGRERLFTARPFVNKSNHFGGRILFHGGHLFLTLGDRDVRELAQRLDNHHGKILRLREDGGVPPDNPFVGKADTLPEIWSWGHRNPQGLVIHPQTGEIWSNEHGPRGGDEINVIHVGRNYGWPVITYGREYAGPLVGEGLWRRDGLEQPLHYWVPSIAPSGMAFYTGDLFPGWRGSLFTGALALRHLNRVVLRNNRVVLEERLLDDKNWRVRSLTFGPDGLYVGVDGGQVVRIAPEPAPR